MKENLLKGTIHTVKQFADNVRLVFKNSTTYNTDTSQIYADASFLLQEFEGEISHIEPLTKTSESLVKLKQLIFRETCHKRII